MTGDGPGEEVVARAGWSLVVEPGDPAAGAVVAALGAARALAWARWAVAAPEADAIARLRHLVRETGTPEPSSATRPAGRTGACPPEPSGAARPAGRTGACPPETARSPLDPWSPAADRGVALALPRWAPRLAGLDARPALDALVALAGTLLVPGDPRWPAQVDDLGTRAPLCLWVRGDPDLAALSARSAAVVGARAATAYGVRVAADLAAGLAERGVTVVSGGAFGIDVAAHRGALAAGGRTVALLAGGVDRPSPAGNLAVLERLVDEGGALVAESPPGTSPSRSRFLQRNRVIAALAGATVVVEAAWRSGALSTAARAGDLLRPVGAVPGPVTSMASVGCHRLLRDGAAVCVTDAADVAELVEVHLRPGSDDREGWRAHDDRPGSAVRDRAGPGRCAAADRSGSPAARVLDALGDRRASTTAQLARRSGLAERDVATTLGLLELAGDARRTTGGWRLVTP